MHKWGWILKTAYISLSVSQTFLLLRISRLGLVFWFELEIHSTDLTKLKYRSFCANYTGWPIGVTRFSVPGADSMNSAPYVEPRPTFRLTGRQITIGRHSSPSVSWTSWRKFLKLLFCSFYNKKLTQVSWSQIFFDDDVLSPSSAAIAGRGQLHALLFHLRLDINS
jgi:hypothetical protein